MVLRYVGAVAVERACVRVPVSRDAVGSDGIADHCGRRGQHAVNLRLPRRLAAGSIAEHFGALASLRDAGLIRHLGAWEATPR